MRLRRTRCVCGLLSLSLPAACTAGAIPEPRACVVLAAHAAVPDIKVQAGTELVSVSLEDAQVSLTLRPGQEQALLEAHSPLRFRTPYLADGVELRVRQQVKLYEGRLVIGQGARPAWLGARGDEMLFSLAPNLQVSVDPPPALACRDLTIARKRLRSSDRYSDPHRLQPAAARFVGLGSGSLPLHLTPKAREALSIKYAGPFELVQREEGWAHVRAEWVDGSKIEGWTPQPRIQSDIQWPEVRVEGGSSGGGCVRTDQRPPHRVEVAEGTAVTAAPEGPVWAHFSARQWVEAEVLPEVDQWLAVVSVAGVSRDSCALRSQMWVRSRDVRWGPSR